MTGVAPPLRPHRRRWRRARRARGDSWQRRGGRERKASARWASRLVGDGWSVSLLLVEHPSRVSLAPLKQRAGRARSCQRPPNSQATHAHPQRHPPSRCLPSCPRPDVRLRVFVWRCGVWWRPLFGRRTGAKSAATNSGHTRSGRAVRTHQSNTNGGRARRRRERSPSRRPLEEGQIAARFGPHPHSLTAAVGAPAGDSSRIPRRRLPPVPVRCRATATAPAAPAWPASARRRSAGAPTSVTRAGRTSSAATFACRPAPWTS